MHKQLFNADFFWTEIVESVQVSTHILYIMISCSEVSSTMSENGN